MPSSTSSSTLSRAVLPSQLPFELDSLPEPSSPFLLFTAAGLSLLASSSSFGSVASLVAEYGFTGSPLCLSTSPILTFSSSSFELFHRSPSPSPSTSSSVASSTSSSSDGGDDSLLFSSEDSFSSFPSNEDSSFSSDTSSASSLCDSHPLHPSPSPSPALHPRLPPPRLYLQRAVPHPCARRREWEGREGREEDAGEEGAEGEEGVVLLSA
ncbi:hypothetical protein JCM8547_001228 [Rhodosporidiobolus lusitaniae]